MFISLLCFSGLILAAGVAALRHAWKHAPEGREDETGFSITGAHAAPIAHFHSQRSDSNRAA